MNLFFRNKSHSLPESIDTPIGILAGTGILPSLIAKKLKAIGYPTIVTLIENDGEPELMDNSTEIEKFRLSEGQKVLDFLKKQGVRHLVLAGGIPKKIMYNNDFKPDSLVADTMSKAKSGNAGDDRILKVVSTILKLNGIQAIGCATVLNEDVTPQLVMTRRLPTERELLDIRFGLDMARAVGRLDIGQTVIVKNKTVIVVEALEGTDRAIQRVAELGIDGAVVVKAAKPQQDLRFDMPILGESTLDNAKKAGCTVICAQAHKTLILNRSKVVQKADIYDMSLVGV